VFTLASELDERIRHLQIWNLRPERPFEFFTLGIAIATTIFMLLTLSFLGNVIPNSAHVIDAYNAGKYSTDIKGLFQFIADLEQSRRPHDQFRMGEAIPLVSLVMIFLGGLGGWYFLRKYFYPFNFAWGEQLAAIERRERHRNFILITVFLAAVIGTVTSYLAGYLPRF
jgi:hypothetical protein